MIHGLNRSNAKLTACGLHVTQRKDQWEHPLASDGGPLTTYPVCVNCSACLKAGAGYAEIEKCGEWHPVHAVWCTLKKGHAGQHRADLGSRMVARWKAEPLARDASV